MFSLFSKKDAIDSRKSVCEVGRPARPWPFLASSPPVQRLPPRRSMSMPQHVAIFSDAHHANPSLSNSSSFNGSSTESSPKSGSSLMYKNYGEMRLERSASMDSQTNVDNEAYRQDMRQLRTSVIPGLF